MELHVSKVNLGAERKSTKKIPNSFKMGTSSHRVVLFLVCVCFFLLLLRVVSSDPFICTRVLCVYAPST